MSALRRLDVARRQTTQQVNAVGTAAAGILGIAQAASGAIAAAFFGLFGFIFLITQYFQIVRGYGVLEAGLATLPFALVIGAMSPVVIVLMKRFGTTAVVGGGLALMSSGPSPRTRRA